MKRKVITKAEMVNYVSSLNPNLKEEVVAKAVNTFFDSIIAALTCGDKVELRKFCSLSVKIRPERLVRDPRTNEQVVSKAKALVNAKASKDIVKALNRDKSMP